MAIEVFGNYEMFHKVVKVEVVNGHTDGVKKVVIHQLVETERDDFDFEPFNKQFVMEHTIDLFPAENNIEVTT